MKKIMYMVLTMMSMANTLVSQEKNEAINAYEADSAVWTYIFENPCKDNWTTGTITISRDTVINGVVWKQASISIKDKSFIEEDEDDEVEVPLFRADGQKIYYRDANYDTEFLLYDFSLNKGDSLVTLEGFDASVITNTDSVLSCGVKRKSIEIYESIAIEGIGYITEFLSAKETISSQCDNITNLAVCTANGKVIYYDPKYADEKGNITFVANEQIPQLNASITYSDGQIRVVCEKTFSVSVYNLQGQLILQRDGCQGNIAIPFGSEASGVYVVNVSDGAGSYSQKIVR